MQTAKEPEQSKTVLVEPFRVVNRYKVEAPVSNKELRTVGGAHFDNRERYTAQSALLGLIDDHHYTPTIDEARDILAWAYRGACA